MKSKSFCTLFDRNYLLKGLVMLRTLYAHCPDVHCFVLCMDDETHDLVGKLAPGPLTRIRLAEIEDEALLAVKPGRTRGEYCWTLTPALPWYILQRWSEVDHIVYVDADLMFYSAVQPIFDEMGTASISIIEHRYTERLKHLDVQGRFNVQWVGFRRDDQGIACLARWRAQCIEWCFGRIEPDRMADQKYLDRWPTDYSSVCIIQHPGAGLAPWNFPRYRIKTEGDRVSVDEVPLIFYHFHQMQILRGGGFSRLAAIFQQDGPAPESVYEPYERALTRALSDVRTLAPGFNGGVQPRLPIYARRLVQNLLPLGLKSALRRFVRL